MSLAFWVVLAAVMMGAGLGLRFLNPAWPRLAWIAAIHGLVGTCGLALLLLALRTPDAKADASGIGAFSRYAAVLIACAWIAGLGLAFWPFRNPRSLGLLIAIHGTIAVSGFVLFMAYRSLG